MSKYLVKVNYTSEGTRGLQREGGTARKTYIEKLISELGGKVESFYFAFGEIDAYLVIDLPDTASAAAVSFAVNSSGAVQLSLTPLLTPEEIDAASKKAVKYSPPGRDK